MMSATSQEAQKVVLEHSYLKVQAKERENNHKASFQMLLQFLPESKQPCPAELVFEGDVLFNFFWFFFYGQKMSSSALLVGFLPLHQLPGHLCPALPACFCPLMLAAQIFKSIWIFSLKYLIKWQRQTFSIWQTLFDYRTPVPPRMELSSLPPPPYFNVCHPNLSPCSPYLNTQQCPLSSVSARQKCLPQAVFGGIITWLERTLLFLCCSKQSSESEAWCSLNYASLQQ